MPRLLELRDEEEHIVERTDVVWLAIRDSSSDGSSRARDEVLAHCALKWTALVAGAAYLRDVIARVQELHDQRIGASRPASWPVSHEAWDLTRTDGASRQVLAPKTLTSVRPCVVVNHCLVRMLAGGAESCDEEQVRSYFFTAKRS